MPRFSAGGFPSRHKAAPTAGPILHKSAVDARPGASFPLASTRVGGKHVVVRVSLAGCRPLAGLVLLIALASPARAQSAAPLQSGAWCGNVTATSATVCVRLAASGERVRLVVSANEDLSAPGYSAVKDSTAATGNAVALDIAGLQPGTRYYYGLEVSGVLLSGSLARGRFRTFPQGAASFKLALVGDCDYRTPDQRALLAVAAEDPLLLLFNGDLHYEDIQSADPEAFRHAYDNVLDHPEEGALLRQAALAYVWDDHDSAGGDNSNGTAPGVAAARSVYRDYVPHYPLGVGDGTIGQAFTVGRVRVIMTDLRSASMPSSGAESPNKTRLGVAQKAWFKQELINARDAGFPLVIWLCSTPWVAAPEIGADTWGGYATERREIADFLKANRIRNLVIYSGDMHALAYDDGTHSDYATGGGVPLIVLHAAPLTQEFNLKGGPYTVGPFLASQQYGMLEITDNGGPTVQASFTGWRVGEGMKFAYQFVSSASAIESRGLPPIDPNPDRALVNISARGLIASPTAPLFAGFVVGGQRSRTILLRAAGPSLAALGVTDAVALPVLQLFRGANLIASNDHWSLLDASLMTAAFDRVGAFRFASVASRDAALLLPLEPGAYTVQASGAGGGVGSVLLEVYEVP